MFFVSGQNKMKNKMNIETCQKYFDFLNRECDRYLKDDRIDENEMHQLKIEFDRFVDNVRNSDLPATLKNKVIDLNLDYVYSEYREFGNLLGYWNIGKYRKQRKLKNKVEEFKFHKKGMSMFIKMNY